MEKTLSEMTNRELFTVLTGDSGVMPQMVLQNIVKSYLASHNEDADLVTMVQWEMEKDK